MMSPESSDIIGRQVALSQKNRFNSCVIVHDEFHPKDLLEKLFFALMPSATFVVFS